MNAKVNPLAVSDEDFLNQPEPEEETVSESTETTQEETTETETTNEETREKTSETGKETSEETSEEEQENTERTSEAAEETGETTEEGTEETRKGAEEIDSTEETTAKKKDKTDSTKETTVDYKVEYEKLLAPFKANGRQMQVKGVDDALTLMKMGANYNKKMAALKPNLRLMKMLENNELLDENKLSYLIDLDKKDPDAVHKFIKESGIDPLEIDTTKDTDYTPKAYTVNDSEVELDGVLDELRDTPSFQRTVDIIGNKWDASSKKVLIETPAIIRVINEQIDNGIFDQITDVIESERMLGRLQGLSDLEAYKQVGDAIQAKGGFKVKNSSETTEETTTTTSTSTSQDDPKLKDRKRAASTTRAAPTTKKKENDYNPLSLSDAEFEKIAGNDFI